MLSLTLLALMLIAAGQAFADLPSPPAIPDLPPTATPAPTGSITHGGSSGGNSGRPSATYATYSPSPTPTPVPSDDLAVVIPESITVNGVKLSIMGNVLYAPGGTVLSEVVKNETFYVVLPSGDNSTSKLTFTIETINASAAEIRTVRLVSEKMLEHNGEKVGILLSATIAGWPAGGRLDAVLVEPVPLNVADMNEQIRAYLDTKYEPDPLAVIDVRKSGLENGKDISDCTIILTMKRPAGVDDNATYGALRQSDGIYERLNATLLSQPGADPMVIEISSPGGFSEFTLVRASATAVETPLIDDRAAIVQDTAPGVSTRLMFLLTLNLIALTITGYVFVKRRGG